MGFARWFIRVLIILFVVRVIVTFLRSMLGQATKPGAGRSSSKTPERIGGKLVKCAECGTYVPEERAIKVGRGDTAQCFCSAECRDKWAAGSERRAASE